MTSVTALAALVTLADLRRAQALLRPVAVRTPLLASDELTATAPPRGEADDLARTLAAINARPAGSTANPLLPHEGARQ